MKVLLLKRLQTLRSAFPGDILTHSLFMDFAQLGFESKAIGLNSFGPRLLAVLSQGHPSSPLRLASIRRAIRIIEDFRPDVIFTAFQDPVIHRIAGNTPIVHWEIEAPLAGGGDDRFVAGFADQCAYVFSAAATDGGYEFLPLAASPRIFRPVTGLKLKYPVVFTGSWYRDREEKFRQMLYPLGSTAHTFGSDWPHGPPGGVQHHGRVDPFMLPRVYSSSSVCLNIHHPNVALHGGLNLRTFEILACRGLMVCDEVWGMDEFLEPGRDFVEYREGEPIKEVVRRAIELESANRISENGYRRFLSEHTTLHRAKRISAIMRSL